MPRHFVTSALGTTRDIIELLGFFIPAAQVLVFVAAAETVVGIVIEARKWPLDEPLRSGKTAWMIRTGGGLDLFRCCPLLFGRAARKRGAGGK